MVKRRNGIKAWIEAMRLRTLPVSVAGVLAGCACALFYGTFRILPALCCLLFAVGAQIASNFANEYYDFKNGLDRKGREGFRRGVTEGDISPRAMRNAVFLTLLLAALPGCALIIWGGWWLIIIGIIIAMFALAYSTGPYPLSHHGLGDVAVVIFFGLVPVGFTAWLQAGSTDVIPLALLIGLGTGLLTANVLIVNNYRDMEDDAAVGKRTTVVIFGRRVMSKVYLADIIVGTILLCSPVVWGAYGAIFPLVMIIPGIRCYRHLIAGHGAELNILLKQTSILVLCSCAILLVEGIIL